ncbi:NitT/TauT family transport system substrate-binding protein [Hydrogenispora ethanolica]|uniref:NitT/TauT family transport system substrate-binding protein n=1 Tax=Hydrogenispora ethanolica TaxID=1082276 RepID=A0A4R1SAC8_HYDET|nr:ABC transporter substrate-binding protein [Hydrogenispora ethanolica]TCL76466.1 NitT/TauT family transport system substrate-binding protein [Hydrogenispora ethanolica]
MSNNFRNSFLTGFRSGKFLLVLLIAFCMMGTAEGASSKKAAVTAPKELLRLNVAYHPHLVGLGAILAAEKQGYFKQENLEVQMVRFTAGPPEIAAMIAGDIDIGYLGVGAHVFGPKGQCVMLAMDCTDLSSEIMVTKKSGIKSIKNLAGKTIGITKGTTSELFLSLALKRAKIDPSKVNIVNMDAAGKVAAFMTNKVDGISIESPYTDQIRKSNPENTVTIQTSRDFLPKAVFPNSWVTTPRFIENPKNQEAVVRFLKCLLKGQQYRIQHMDETVGMVADYLGQPKEIIGSLVDKTNFLDNRSVEKIFKNGTALKWYEQHEKMFVDAGLLDKFVPAQDFVKPQYLMAALKELRSEK